MVDVAHSENNKDDENNREKIAEEQEPAGDSDREGDVEAEAEPGKKKKKPRSFWKELPILIGVALVLTLLIQTFLARVFVIPSESMEETLHGCPGCYGDRVLVDKLVYTFGDPEAGEVVVFERPSTWNRSEFVSNRSSNGFVAWLQDIGAAFGLASPDEDDVVKRVVAVGGQTVRCCDEGRILVDDKPIDESYVYWLPGSEGKQEEFKEVTVPPGHLFVLGDNRNNSCDSRCQGGGGRDGMVPVDNVIGKVRFIVLPPARWQGVGDHNPQTAAIASSMSAAAWQVGVPAGTGLLFAWPTVWIGRRLRSSLRGGTRL